MGGGDFVADGFAFDEVGVFEGVDNGRYLLLRHTQNLRRLRFQVFLRHVDVAFLGHAVERVGHARFDAPRIVRGQTQRLSDFIGRLKADAVHIVDQSVRRVLHHRQRLVAVLLVDFGRQSGGNAMRLQEKHHVLDGPLLLPRFNDALHPLVADAQHLAQFRGLVVDNVQRLFAEAVDDALGHHPAHAANEAGAEVAFDAFSGRGQ